MSINDLLVLSVLRTKMQWHQERQRVLSENVSNSDTPNFKPRDLVQPKFDSTAAGAGSVGSMAMMRTATGHIRTKLCAGSQGKLPDQARRQCRQSRGRNAQGVGQPDGLRGGDLALQQEPASSEDRDRQGLRPDNGRRTNIMASDGGDFARSMSIATSGLRAQAGRMRVISENIANADSTAATAGGDPYRRKVPTFTSELDRTLDAKVVALGKVRPDSSAFRVKHEPSNPAADTAGNVKYPNVNPLIEMTDMRDAQRSYEANLNIISATRRMIQRTLDILKA